MNLLDYLHVDKELLTDHESRDREFRIVPTILEVEVNPFYLPIPKNKRLPVEKLKHYSLELNVEQKWVEPDEDEENNWHQAEGYLGSVLVPIPFYMTKKDDKAPDINDFSSYIYEQCSIALFSLYNPKHYNNSRFTFKEFRQIEMVDVYVYLKLLKKDKEYKLTKTFIKDYWHWHRCLYDTQKWFHYLLGDLSHNGSYSRWIYPVGWKLLEFIPPSDFPKNIDNIRAEVSNI
jgi:hypothetical protein